MRKHRWYRKAKCSFSFFIAKLPSISRIFALVIRGTNRHTAPQTSEGSPHMSINFRHRDILSLARKEGKVTVEGLAQKFDVTLQTIRRDLSELSEAGHLERVHGGAMLPSATSNIRYEERRRLNAASKTAIARVCAAQIPDGVSLFLNIGTTTEAVARALAKHKDILVVTNNVNVAAILMNHPDCRTVLTGGDLRRADGGLVGKLATDTITQFKFDIAVIGCSALDQDGDLLDFDIQEVGVSQAILKQSRQTFLVADTSKFQRSAPARIASLADMDKVFTDAPLPGDLSGMCASHESEVVVASP